MPPNVAESLREAFAQRGSARGRRAGPPLHRWRGTRGPIRLPCPAAGDLGASPREFVRKAIPVKILPPVLLFDAATGVHPVIGRGGAVTRASDRLAARVRRAVRAPRSCRRGPMLLPWLAVQLGRIKTAAADEERRRFWSSCPLRRGGNGFSAPTSRRGGCSGRPTGG